MKMKELKSWYKLFMLVALWLGVSQQTWAFDLLFSTYRYSVSVGKTGSGTVYLSETNLTTNSEGIVENVTYENSINGRSFSETVFLQGFAQKTLYVYAKPAQGYVFQNWTLNPTTNSSIADPANNHTSVSLRSSTTNNTGQRYTITANFVLDNGMVKVVSANSNYGSATINNINNVAGEVVTITAIPRIALQGVKFLYWTKTEEGGTEEIVQNSTAEMRVTATTVKTTYTAYFSDPVETKGVFCRIKNKQTNRYLSVIGDQPASRQEEGSGSSSEVYFILNSMSTVASTAETSDPSTIFFLSGEDDGHQGMTGLHLLAQGVNVHEKIITSELGHMNLEYTANGYKAYIVFSNQGNSTRLYLRNDDSGIRFKVNDDANALWDIEIIDEDSMDEYYFGMAPKSYFTKTHNGEQKYYTTLYTSFGYKLMDGVNAYYIDKDNVEENIRNGRVYLSEIPAGSIISGKRAVILECSTPGDAKANRLLPVSTDVDPDAAYWPLQGYIKLNGDAVYPSAYEDSGHEFYVLSVNSDHEKLGFYKYSKELSSNKAFAVVPSEYVNDAKTARVIWYGDETDHVNNIEFIFPEKEQYYDLQGRKVENPQKGIYIINGRKVIK